MSLTPDVYLQIRDGQTYGPKLLDPSCVLDVTWDYQEQGGLAQISATLAVSWETTSVLPGDYMEVWVLGETVPRARGIVSTPERRLDLKETNTLLAFGRMADMDKVLDYKVIFHPSGSSQDLSYYAAELLSDYQQRKAVGSAASPPLDIDIQVTGSSMESLTLPPGSVRSGFDQLYAQAGGNVVWGWDIHPVTGNDRCYLRLRQSIVGSQFFVGGNVRLVTAPAELVPVTNAVYFKGGPAKYPNLLTNASFEQPTNPSADSGSLLQDSGFEMGLSAWSLSGGASRNQHDPGTSHNASAHSGDWYLLLDGTNEKATQDVPVTVGTAYLATVFARAENGQHLPTGLLTITGISSSGSVTETPTGGSLAGGILAIAPQSVTWTGGAASSVVGSDALQTSVVFTNPATVKARITLSCTATSGAGFGLCLDDATFGPVGGVGQYGWSTHLQNAGSAANAFNWIIWACKAAAWDGAYGIRASITANFSNKPVLAVAGNDSSGDSRFHFKPSSQQSLNCGFFARMTPGQNTSAGAVRVAYREWAGDGHETQSQFSPSGSTWAANVPNDGLWHLVMVSVSAHGDASTATMQAEFGASGVYDLDGFFVRDAAAPITAAQDPLTANYLRGADFERYVTAESVCISGSAADAAATASAQTWGRREAALTNDQVIDWTPDAQGYLQAWFQRNAVLLQRPKVELIGETRQVVLPGDGLQVAISGTGKDLTPQWCSHASYKFSKSSLDVSLDLSNERPTLAKMLKAGQASGGSASSSVGAPSGGGQTAATTPAAAPVTSVNTKLGDVVLGAGDVGAEAGLGNPGTSGYVLSSTAAGVRSWVPGGGFTPAAPVAPTSIAVVSKLYDGTSMIVTFGAAQYGADIAASLQIYQWQRSIDGGATWQGYDGTSSTTFQGGGTFPSGITSGVIRARARTENALGAVSGWTTMTSDVVYSAPPVRTVALTFSRAGTLTTGRNKTVFTCPAGLNLTLIGFRAGLEAAGTSATALQLVKSAGTGAAGSTSGFSTSSTSQSFGIASGAKAGNTDSISTALVLAPGDQIDLSVTTAGTGAADLSAEAIFSY